MARIKLPAPEKCLKESQEATLFKRLADINPIARKYLIAIPNGGKRDAKEARNLKIQGVKAGVSDYFLAYPCGGKAGLWIELKRKDRAISKPTLEQIDWLALMKNVGYESAVAHGADEAMAVMKNYLERGYVEKMQ